MQGLRKSLAISGVRDGHRNHYANLLVGAPGISVDKTVSRIKARKREVRDPFHSSLSLPLLLTSLVSHKVEVLPLR